VADLIFNANPLIKLDGYYFLSQWLRLPNLMDRSRGFRRDLLKQVLFGETVEAARRRSLRERAIYCSFGLMSFAYTIGLRTVIVFYAGAYLAREFHFAGLMAAAGLGVFYLRRPLGQLSSAISRKARGVFETRLRGIGGGVMRKGQQRDADRAPTVPRTNLRRRRVVWIAVALVLAAVLCVRWTASVGGYGTLMTIPGREMIIRAPEDATLIELRAQPGEVISSGSLIGRMGNVALEEQIVQAQVDLARASADRDRLLRDLRVREEAASRAELQLARQQHEFYVVNSEQEQINRAFRGEAIPAVRLLNVSSRTYPASVYPAALAALQADVDMLKVQLEEATTRADRSRELFDRGVVAQSEFESARTRSASLSLELVRARQRLEAAVIEHGRKHTGSSIDLRQASSDLRGEHLQSELLGRQLNAACRVNPRA